MSERLERLKEKGSGALAWCGKHKVVSIIIVILAIGLFYNNVIAKNTLPGRVSSTSGEQGSQEKDLLTSGAQAFLEEYGCYSYMDALDAEQMSKYAHDDLCKAVVGERETAYIYQGETFDAQTSQQVALDRMRILGLVKTCDLKSMALLSQDANTYQISAELDEYTFTNDKGIQKASAAYILEMRKNEEAGTDFPYEVIRIFKE